MLPYSIECLDEAKADISPSSIVESLPLASARQYRAAALQSGLECDEMYGGLPLRKCPQRIAAVSSSDEPFKQ